MRKVTFTVEIPIDAFDTVEEAAEHAIHEAREMAEDFVIPAHWKSSYVRQTANDYVFSVVRTSHNK